MCESRWRDPRFDPRFELKSTHLKSCQIWEKTPTRDDQKFTPGNDSYQKNDLREFFVPKAYNIHNLESLNLFCLP